MKKLSICQTAQQRAKIRRISLMFCAIGIIGMFFVNSYNRTYQNYINLNSNKTTDCDYLFRDKWQPQNKAQLTHSEPDKY